MALSTLGRACAIAGPRSRLHLVHLVIGALSSEAVGALTLKPVDSDDPPAGLVPYEPVRGIVIYWRPASPQPVKRRRRQRFRLPLPDSQAQQVGFPEVSASRADEPPRDAEEEARFVRLACALVACSRPIRPMLEMAYQAFGAQRMTWGGDYPLVNQREGYKRALQLTMDEFKSKSNEDRDLSVAHE